MENRLATIAENVANLRTVGFKAEAIDFDTVLSAHATDQVAFATVGDTFIERRAGPMEPTGNPLDLAIAGGGYFGIETPSGRAYTRDGRLTISATGDLMTLTGHPVLSDGGAGIAVDPAAGEVTIGLDGSITQNGQNVGIIGLFDLPANAELTRVGDSAFRMAGEAEPVVDRVSNSIRQGFVENSNVNPVAALHQLIVAQRSFEQAFNATGDREDALGRALRELGAQ